MFQVGDVVLVIKSYHAKPLELKCIKVTPSGKVRIETLEKYLFTCNDTRTKGDSNGIEIYENTKTNFDKFTQDYQEYESYKQECEENRKKEIAVRIALQDAQLQKTKTDFQNDYIPYVIYDEIEVINKRRYTVLKIPVKEQYREHKGNYEFVTVHCRAAQYRLKDDDKLVEFSYTRCNKNSTTFVVSCSGNYAKTEDEAIWLSIDYCYHNSY